MQDIKEEPTQEISFDGDNEGDSEGDSEVTSKGCVSRLRGRNYARLNPPYSM